MWRGENTQRGRYREFMQCDFDTIGTLSVAADIETGLVINALLSAIGFERFTIHLNNRQVLNGLLQKKDWKNRLPQFYVVWTSLPRLEKTKSFRK